MIGNGRIRIQAIHVINGNIELCDCDFGTHSIDVGEGCGSVRIQRRLEHPNRLLVPSTCHLRTIQMLSARMQFTIVMTSAPPLPPNFVAPLCPLLINK